MAHRAAAFVGPRAGPGGVGGAADRGGVCRLDLRLRGYFAVHTWIIYKRAGEAAYTRYDVIGWGGANVVPRNYAVPDRLWFGATPRVLADHRGVGVEQMIDAIEAAVASYPHAGEYRRSVGRLGMDDVSGSGETLP